jgi:hypothetical protein
MDEIHFSLNLSAIELLALYRGDKRFVVVRSREGKRVQFPASALRPFITPTGVRGDFRLRFDASHRLIDIKRTA